MGLNCSKHQAKRWAFELSLVLAAALTWHFVRIYPWHRLYLAKASSLSFLEHQLAPPVSQQGQCFQPRDTASRSRSSFDGAAPIGSMDEAGLDRHHCFHYSSRFEPYLEQAWGNDYIAKTQERIGLQDKTSITGDLIWYANLLAEHEPQAFPHVSWPNLTLSTTCPTDQGAALAHSQAASLSVTSKHRVAFVLRCYQDFVWTHDAILHLRALIWELRTSSLPFDVDVHLLLEVKDASSYVSMFTESGRKRILRGSVPIEFWSIASLWSEQEMILRYPLCGDFREGIQAAGSYRGCLLPLQRFASQHTEYDSVINWELDTRFTHTYDHLLESIWTYAHQASAKMFTKWPVQGDNVKTSDVGETCKDKIADVVIFSPVRNPKDSGWYWEYDVQGYPSMQSTTRAASVGTNMWLSKRTLFALENITADQHQSLFCEAMVPTLVLHSTTFSLPAAEDQCPSQLKLVHYPHPVAFAYQASPAKLDQLLNPSSAILAKHREEVLKDTSYYYASTIAGQIYSQWRMEADGCIAPLLLHPVKGPVSRGKREGGFRFGSSNGLSLCDASASGDKCAEIVKADVKRYLDKDVDSNSLKQRSLAEWDLRGRRYISKRTWIMNSSTRSLVQTIAIVVIAFSVCRFLVGLFSWRKAISGQNEYIPLPAN